MEIGVSTGCFYPALTEEALDTALGLGFRTVEVFLNTPSEVEPAFSREMRAKAEAAGARIVSLHPYFSLAEPFCLFSRYERRFFDALSDYRRQFEAAATVGASFLILHGDRADQPPLSPEQFAERYERLYDEGQRFGVTLLQENVAKYRASDPAFVRQMRALLGEKARFALDLKQCRLTGVPAADMIDAMGPGLCHVHFSDGTEEAPCLLPGEGREDFAALFQKLRESGYRGDGVIELYRRNYKEPEELPRGRKYLLEQM